MIVINAVKRVRIACLTGAKLKYICLLMQTYVSKLTGKSVHDYLLTTYSYDDSRAVEPLYGPYRMEAVGGLTLIGGTAAALGLFFLGPMGWAAIPVGYLAAGTASLMVNHKAWKEDTARLKVYTSSANFNNFLEAAFLYNMVEQKIARIDYQNSYPVVSLI